MVVSKNAVLSNLSINSTDDGNILSFKCTFSLNHIKEDLDWIASHIGFPVKMTIESMQLELFDSNTGETIEVKTGTKSATFTADTLKKLRKKLKNQSQNL